MKGDVVGVQMSKTTKNIIVSVSVHLISLVTSFVLGFIVPRYIDEVQYAYWQTYILYFGYASLLTLGISEGIILRYAQYDYDQLDKKRVRSQFFILCLVNIVVCIIASVVIWFSLHTVYKWIYILVLIGCLIRNLFDFSSYILQCTNRISYYAAQVVVQRVLYGLFVVFLLVFGIEAFYWFCIAQMFGDAVAFILSIKYNREIYIGKLPSLPEWRDETRKNISGGIVLLFANLTSSLIVGSAKMIIQWRWDEYIFGKISFAISIFNAFLSVIVAVSVVMFPALKRARTETLPGAYSQMRSMLSTLLFFCLLFYQPLCWFLERWVPKYATGLPYLGIMLPMLVFCSKVALLTNNYMKIYRKEKNMSVINAVSVVICLTVCLVSAYVFNSLDMVVYSLVFSLALRSVVSEIYVRKLIGNKTGYADYFVEIAMTVIYLLSIRFLPRWQGMGVYAVCLTVYLLLNKNAVKQIFRRVIG